MWALGFALFVVFTIGMPLVIVVALFATLAMVLAVAVSLGLGMAAVTVAIVLGGCGFGLAATLQDEGSRADPYCEDYCNGDQVFLLMVDLLEFVFMVMLSVALRSGREPCWPRAGGRYQPLHGVLRQGL